MARVVARERAALAEENPSMSACLLKAKQVRPKRAQGEEEGGEENKEATELVVEEEGIEEDEVVVEEKGGGGAKEAKKAEGEEQGIKEDEVVEIEKRKGESEEAKEAEGEEAGTEEDGRDLKKLGCGMCETKITTDCKICSECGQDFTGGWLCGLCNVRVPFGVTICVLCNGEQPDAQLPTTKATALQEPVAAYQQVYNRYS